MRKLGTVSLSPSLLSLSLPLSLSGYKDSIPRCRAQRGCALVDAKDRQWDRVCAFGDRCRRCAAALP